MNSTHAAALLRSMSGLASRRGIIGGLASGLVATGIHTIDVDEVEARKKGKGKRKRKNRKKDKNPQPAGPVARADATCSTAVTRFFFSPNRRVAQTFTAIASGPLVRAELRIFKDAGSSGDYVLHLGAVDNFGVPTNEVLAVASVANRDVPENETTVTFTFATPFAVEANAQYALVLTRTGSDRLAWFGSRGDLCAGQAFFSPDRTSPFEADTLGNNTDVNFTTFVSN